MHISNPFRPTRFEHQDHPLIWLSPNVSLLEGQKSLYLAGTRGSGKTSLLKAVNWRERVFNKTLVDQIGTAETMPYVAVYFRLPDYLSGAIDKINWATIRPNAPDIALLEYDFFGKIIELIAAQLVCDAFAGLRAAGRFEYSPNDESEVVAAIIGDYPNVFGSRPQATSFFELSQILKSAHRMINLSVVRGELEAILDQLPYSVPGVFINDLCSRIRSLACGKENHACPPGFHIKICIDDCETLRSSQQKYLNTLVRNSSSPVFWVVSYVSSEYDTTTTMTLSQSLTDADRRQHDLNSEKEEDFKVLCEAVSLLRLYYSMPEAIEKPAFSDLGNEFFRLDKLLGSRTINRMIVEATRSSVSPAMSELSDRAKHVQSLIYTKNAKRDSSTPPIWETYIVEKLGINVENYIRQHSVKALTAYLRRKQVAALLCICAAYKLRNIPYAGSNTVVWMSDLCVRDYLENMASIFDVAVDRGEISGITDVVNRQRPLSLETQRRGLVSSSANKFEGIKNSLEQDWAEVMKIIECLGKLCALLQSDPNNLASLTTPERGVFVFNYKLIPGHNEADILKKRENINRILHRCEADGLLRLDPNRISAEENSSFNLDGDRSRITTVAYRLHRRFAANFGFSHRGPYEAVTMPMDEFASLCDQPNSYNTDKWVERVYSKINASFGQPSLFGR